MITFVNGQWYEQSNTGYRPIPIDMVVEYMRRLAYLLKPYIPFSYQSLGS